MNIRPRRRRSIAVDITALIDVVFLLLIFFMVSTTFEHETQILLELPQASGQEAKEQPNDLEITVDRHGVFYVNKLEVINTEIETLKTAIGKVIGDRRDMTVIITADAMTPHQSVMTVMDAASQMGLTHMTFTAQQPKE